MSRSNQRRRTRKDLLQAAARLMKTGRTPTLEEIAEEALVSRATAYRYFPGLDALFLEASLDVAVPGPDEIFADNMSGDVADRLLRVDSALHTMIAANETALRAMLAHSLQRAAQEGDVPARQNRRTPSIEAALAPLRDRLDPRTATMLAHAVALVVGIEAVVVFKDVLQLDDDQAREVRTWAIRALSAAALGHH